MQWTRSDFVVSDDPAKLDLDAVCRLLRGSYWAGQRPRETIELSIQNSIPFGLYHGTTQIGFARVVTDHATVAWICDVLIDPDHRAAGLGKWLVECVLAHPDIADCVKLLRTRDAHSLYEQFGFSREECMIRKPAGYNWTSVDNPGNATGIR